MDPGEVADPMPSVPSVLLVELDDPLAVRIADSLGSGGLSVHRAPGVRQALAHLSSARVDVVLSDVEGGPDMCGAELCRRVKEVPGTSRIPVVLMAPLGDPARILDGLASGADDLVTRPFEPGQPLAAVRAALDSRAAGSPAGDPHRVAVGIELVCLGRTVRVPADRPRPLSLLLSSLESVAREHRELEGSRQRLDAERVRVGRYAQRLEHQVRISDKKYRSVMDHASDAIFILDLEGRILEANRSAEVMLGLSRDQLRGADYRRFALAEDRDEVARHLARLAATGSERAGSHRLAGTGDRQFEVELSGSVVEIAGIRVLLAIVRDVTERNRLEDQLRQVQKMEAIGQLAAGVAHDFNNLITIVKGYAQITLRALKPGDPLRAGIEQIEKASDRATALTRQLLSFSRRQVVRPRLIDLDAVVAEMEPMLRRLVGEDIDLAVVRDPALGRVQAHEEQMEQILLNLVVNARDAMPDGGRLTIETADVELDEAYARQHVGVEAGGYVMLAVSDTGCGMDSRTQAHIFEPFFTTKEAGKGTGLGLSTVYGIVKQSRGNVWVYSEVGRGTTFKVYLPRAVEIDAGSGGDGRADVSDGRAATTAGRALGRGTETVLVVEDEEMVRSLIRSVLADRGYTVLEAAAGVDAATLGAGHAGPIHLVLSDVVLPQQSGPALFEALARGRPRLRVLYMSGYTATAITRNGLLAAGTPLLVKPFTVETLVTQVRAVLDAAADGAPAPGVD
jgi:PAS domain S-box-containing protein